MLKVISLLIFFTPLNLFSQVDNVFKIYYKPNKLYTIHSEIISESKTSLEGDKSMIDDLNRFSLYPMIFNISIISETSSLTDSATIENIVPLKFSFIKEQTKTKYNNKTDSQRSTLNGSSVDGVFVNKNKFVPRPGSMDQLDEENKQKILKSLEMSHSQILFPEYQLKIGDQFTQKSPMEIPISGLKPIHCTMNTIFTLTDTIKQIAYFNITQAITSDNNDTSSSVILVGSGYGSAEYDIKNNFILKEIINSKISIRVKSTQLDVILDLSNSLNQHIIIE